MPHGNSASINQKHYPDLASDASSVWNFCGDFICGESTAGVTKCHLFSKAGSGCALQTFSEFFFFFLVGKRLGGGGGGGGGRPKGGSP